MDLYKSQLKSPNARALEYPFDKYFEQQIQELDQSSSIINNDKPRTAVEENKDPLTRADTGGPPPPPIPGMKPGMSYPMSNPLDLF